MDPAARLSIILGMEVGGIRVLISLIASFLLAYPYGVISRKLTPSLQHTLNVITGVAFMYYCFGIGILHTLFDISVIAILLSVAGGRLVSVIITWLLVFGHLMWGYYQEVLLGDRMPTCWTTAHCVLTLKLIGLSTSLYDSKTDKKIDDKSSTDRLFSLDSSRVELLEVLGFCCLFCTSIVGPQISFRRYREFVNGTLYDSEKTGGNLAYAINRFGMAIVYTVFYVIVNPYLPSTQYLLTSGFANLPLVNKLIIAGSHFYMFYKKYTIVWLLSDAASAAIGISYNRKRDGSYDWRGFMCIDLWRWETATSAHELITSMNMSVNNWIIYYIYKRFRFLGSPLLSQLAVIIFASVWHGFFPAYFVGFGFQIPIIIFDKSFENFIELYFGKTEKWSLPARIAYTVVYNVYLNIYVSFGVLAFYFLTWEKILVLWRGLNYFGFVIMLVEIPIIIVLNSLTKEKKKLDKSE